MGANVNLSGVYVPLITPFFEGSVAVEDLRALSERSLDAGATGLVALGTTGEPATLTAEEKATVIEVVGEVCRRRNAPFVIGAGGNSTASLEAEVAAVGATPGATALLSVVPYYTRPSEAGIVQHFRRLAAASPVPLIVYNIPYRTGRGLGADSLRQLAAMDNIAGLKQSVGGVDVDTLDFLSATRQGFDLLCGDDPFIFPLLALGGTGAIAASSHVCTEAFVRMVGLASKGDWDSARRLAEKLLPVCRALFVEPSPAIIKGVLAKQGLISSGELRLPMTEASGAAVEEALAAIKAV